MAFCRNCGNELLEGTRFCPKCGAPTQVNTVSAETSDSFQNEEPVTGETSGENTESADTGTNSEQSGNQANSNQQYSQTNSGLPENQANQDWQYSQTNSNQSGNQTNPDQSGMQMTTVTSGNNGKTDNEESSFDKYGKFFGIILFILSFVNFQTDPPLVTIILAVAIIAGCIFCFGRKYKLKFFTVVALIFSAITFLSGISDAKLNGLLGNKWEKELAEAEAMSEETENEKTQKEETGKDYASEASDDEADEDDESYDDWDAEDLEDADVTAVKDSSGGDEDEYEDETSDESKEDDSDESSNDESESADGVDPDLKAFLDSYEDFIDEYIDFMKKYMNDPGNAISMLSEYTEIMEEYQNFADKINAYDADTMSKEDAKYYLDVVNRVSKKMLDLY